MTDKKSTKMKPEDVDDFDELLEEALHDFDNPNLVKPAMDKAAQQKKHSQSATSTASSSSATVDYDLLRENASSGDLLKQLENLSLSGLSEEALAGMNMAELMGKLSQDFDGLDKNVQNFLEPSSEDDKDPELKKLKDELRHLSAKVDEVGDDSGGAKELGKTLAQTLKTLNDTMDNCSADAAASSSTGSTKEEDETVLPFLENMMGTLLSKDVIYPSLKSMRDNYPEWLTKNSSTLSDSDQNRYYSQLDIVRQVCDEYESIPSGQQPSSDKLLFILELMQKMQELGTPPEELLGEDEHLPTLPGAGSVPQCPQM